MSDNTKLPKRKPNRLPQYDYGTTGYYFVTICTANKQKTLCNIVGQGLAPAGINLTELGEIVDEQLNRLHTRYKSVTVDKYVIMPNHIHAIIKIENAAGASPCPTLSDIICAFKSLVTVTYKKRCNTGAVWQNSFHDHIICGKADYLEIWNYIDFNPQKWAEDKYYITDT